MVIHSIPEGTPSQDHKRVGLLLESTFNVQAYKRGMACKSSGKKSKLLLVTFDKEQLKHSIMKRLLNFEKAKGGTLLSNTRSHC